MADTDTAINTDDGYRRFLPPGPLTPEVSTPPPEPVPYGALQPNAPPPADQQPAQTPGGALGPQQGNDDADEDARLALADEEEKNKYAQLRSRSGNYDPIVPDLNHPEMNNLIEAKGLLRQLAAKNSPDYKPSKAVVDKMEMRIRKDIDAKHKANIAQLKTEAANDRVRYENSGARIKTASDVDKMINTLAANQNEKLTTGDDASRLQTDYTIKTSPLTTMKYDGNYNGLRDVVAKVIALNPGMMVDTAVNQVIKMGSPVGTNNGQPVRGYNGHVGRAGAYYDVIGHDVDDNYLVRTSDGGTLAIDPTSFNKIKQARVAGHQLAKQWEVDQRQKVEDKTKPGWLARQLEGIIPSKGF